MSELPCECLNVILHLASQPDLEKALRPADLLIDLKSASSFETLHAVQLGLAGISVMHGCLVQSYQTGDWVVHHCANCGMDTHITHAVKGNTKVYVTNRILASNAKIEDLRNSAGYSTVFKVVLSEVPQDEINSFERQRVSSMSFGTRDPVMKEIHQQMKTFLNEQEAALEERIQSYEKQQRAEFVQLRSKVHRERGLLFRSIAKCRANALLDAASEGTTQKVEETSSRLESSITNSVEESSVTSNNPSSPNHSGSSSYSGGGQARVTITVQDKPVVKERGRSLPNQDSLDDVLFGMDGFDNNASFHSEDEEDIESFTTDDSYREESSFPIQQQQHIAQSLPITMPAYGTPSGGNKLAEQDEMVHLAPRQMAESIKALALSMNQETQMFGDLPKPRTNTTWAR